MDFRTLDPGSFEYGGSVEVAPLVRRVIAENPSKFTYLGTGTYIVGKGDVAVIDPGPRLDSHRDALATALSGDTVRAILVTHCHADHSPLAAWLAAETGAPTVAFGPHGESGWEIGVLPEDFGRPPEAEEDPTEPVLEESTDTDFVPDVTVTTGDLAAEGHGWEMRAIHTPGHTSNHTCFTLDDGTTRTLFTGDHVMGWSTTVVGPPDGDMTAYMESLRAVAGREDDVAIPTHGPPIPNPSGYMNQLIEHRLDRERQVLGAVRAGQGTIPEMVTDLYADVRIELHRPAGASVLAHLVKLVDDGAVAVDGGSRPRLDSTYLAV
jgi:glyoxylase-like metal-dependent hydrolase (beta-lactamase superfamily II)